jgi:hypothetical protein
LTGRHSGHPYSTQQIKKQNTKHKTKREIGGEKKGKKEKPHSSPSLTKLGGSLG